jgi:hypothetical protein
MFDLIDWQQPWLANLAFGQGLLAGQDWCAAFNRQAQALNIQNHRGLGLGFVGQSALPAGVAYEWFISQQGRVPTRDNLHDFFNGLVWLTFPAIKARLNALQAGEIERSQEGQPPTRGRLRDAATLFDENAALLVVDDGAWRTRLREHAWTELFVNRRAEFRQSCDVYLFGHALMEKLVTPYKAITAHAWVAVVPKQSPYWALAGKNKIAWLDGMVAVQLNESLAPADFTPLPVLGVPGWWPDQDEMFYADVQVFRPRREKKQVRG